ncbi:hypothetical protein [Legionella sp. CNM-4043-24]|uniref:hypothetical protein n=1 Tax=Legionella sp. CNM-4043-24 TaxID=3421646 RepID=UPI00403B19E1
MGGTGSGRHWYYGAKSTTNSYRTIDVRQWQREKLLTPGNSFGQQWKCEGDVVASVHADVAQSLDHLMLRYWHRKNGNEWRSFNYYISLVWTDCHLGGQRPWFICPTRGCGCRVAILYKGNIFACRNCFSLAYPSQRETVCYRASRKADKIRSRLGWQEGFLNEDGRKPKGMHWMTFDHLCEQHDNLVLLSLTEAVFQSG